MGLIETSMGAGQIGSWRCSLLGHLGVEEADNTVTDDFTSRKCVTPTSHK